jgi:hypothetical protein
MLFAVAEALEFFKKALAPNKLHGWVNDLLKFNVLKMYSAGRLLRFR